MIKAMSIEVPQPNARLTLRLRPDLVRGIPIARESFPFADERPEARFQENDRPNPRRLPIVAPYPDSCPAVYVHPNTGGAGETTTNPRRFESITMPRCPRNWQPLSKSYRRFRGRVLSTITSGPEEGANFT